MAKQIERIRALQEGKISAPPIAQFLKMTIVKVEDGRVAMEMPLEACYGNMVGTLHGGVICDLADAAMGTAFGTTCQEGEVYVTVELKCNYLRPVWDGFIRAEAWVVHRGKTMGLTECEVRDKENKLVAKLSSTLTILAGENNASGIRARRNKP